MAYKKQLNYKRHIHGIYHTEDVLLDLPQLAPGGGYGKEKRPPKGKRKPKEKAEDRARRKARKEYFMSGLTT